MSHPKPPVSQRLEGSFVPITTATAQFVRSAMRKGISFPDWIIRGYQVLQVSKERQRSQQLPPRNSVLRGGISRLVWQAPIKATEAAICESESRRQLSVNPPRLPFS